MDYTVTSNHIHLLVYDRKKDVIPKSIQLIAGRTGREYNIRKTRKGAFWEDRYHATAVKTGDHFVKCLAYIDLNMVRAGVVRHPSEWGFGGYVEIQNPKQRYTIINRRELANLLGLQDDAQLIESHRKWVEEVLEKGSNHRDAKWTESIAVGDKEYVTETKSKLGTKAVGRNISENNGNYELREPQTPYSLLFGPEKCGLSRNIAWSDRIQSALSYIRQDKPSAATRFRDRVEKTLRRLEDLPETGRIIPEFPELPYREVIVSPYRFFIELKRCRLGCWGSAWRPACKGTSELTATYSFVDPLSTDHPVKKASEAIDTLVRAPRNA